MKIDYLLLGVLLFGCGASSSQMAFYQIVEEEKPWWIKIVKNSEDFECRINDFEVISASFGWWKNSFEVEKLFRAKRVILNGYREVHQNNNRYKIRLFIDEKEIGKFNF